jgi:hypothetical protein
MVGRDLWAGEVLNDTGTDQKKQGDLQRQHQRDISGCMSGVGVHRACMYYNFSVKYYCAILAKGE